MQELSLFDMGVEEIEEVKVKNDKAPAKSVPTKKSEAAVKKETPKPKKEELKVTGEWTIHFATETFSVSDFVTEIPEEGITLEQLRESLERSFAQFSVARTKWDISEEKMQLFPDAFAGSKGGDSPMRVPFFTNIQEAEVYEGSLCYLVGADGQVYENRKSPWGNLVVKTKQVERVQEVEEKFNFHLPKIPNKILAQILAFFQSYTKIGEYEVMLCVYWDKESNSYLTDCPKQVVTKFHIDKQLNPALGGRNSLRYIKVLEIHSHNTMRAYFSGTDDVDEQQYGLYGVVGRLDKRDLEIIIRAKVNDNSLNVPITEVFDTNLKDVEFSYPKEWEKNVLLGGLR